VIVGDTGPLVAAINNDTRHRACVDLSAALHRAGRDSRARHRRGQAGYCSPAKAGHRSRPSS
jgi:hypothetical protein